MLSRHFPFILRRVKLRSSILFPICSVLNVNQDFTIVAWRLPVLGDVVFVGDFRHDEFCVLFLLSESLDGLFLLFHFDVERLDCVALQSIEFK
jgi:hypothetical protein